MKKIIILVFYAISLVVFGFGANKVYQRGGPAFVYDNYLENKFPRADVCFLGDSLTYLCRPADFLPFFKVTHQGVRGNTTQDILNRLISIANAKYRDVYLMAGLNDLFHEVPIDQIESNYRKIVSRLRKKSPEIRIFIQSLLPVVEVNERLRKVNAKIQPLNQSIKDLAEELGLEFVDVHKVFNDFNQPKKLYNPDGYHLSPMGCALWSEELRKNQF